MNMPGEDVSVASATSATAMTNAEMRKIRLKTVMARGIGTDPLRLGAADAAAPSTRFDLRDRSPRKAAPLQGRIDEVRVGDRDEHDRECLDEGQARGADRGGDDLLAGQLGAVPDDRGERSRDAGQDQEVERHQAVARDVVERERGDDDRDQATRWARSEREEEIPGSSQLLVLSSPLALLIHEKLAWFER